MTLSRRGFMLITSPVLCGACASADLTPTIQFSVGVMLRNGNDGAWTAPSPASSQITLLLPLIAGDFFGNTTEPSVATSLMAPSGTLALDLTRLLQATSRIAVRPTNPAALSAELAIEPASIRLARVGSSAIDSSTKRPLGRTGFYGIGDGLPLILVYFSGPCRMRGTTISEPDKVVLELAIPSEGLHWLQLTQLSPGRRLLSLYRGPPQINLGITRADNA